jgi:predicted dehydrogenase
MSAVEIYCGVDPLGHDAPGNDGSFPVYISLRELAQRGKADLVIVSVPTPLHHEVCSELLEYNITPTIWCEKPLVSQSVDAEILTKSAAHRGVDLSVLLHTAFAPEVLWATSELTELVRRHGPPTRTLSVFQDAYVKQLDHRTISLANSWLDSGINALSVLARFFTLGEPIAGSGNTPLNGRASMQFHYCDDEGLASISTSWESDDSHKSTKFTFEDGWSLVLDHSHSTASVLDDSSNEQKTHCFGHTPLGTRYQTMFEAYLAQSELVFDSAHIASIHRRLFEAQKLIDEKV